ncbi:MAG: hypothetical protein ABJG41_11825 [Cyclobacteriaceae bacterium]
MSRSEKKAFKLLISNQERKPYYVQLFELVQKDVNNTSDSIKAEFSSLNPNVSYDTTITYLYKVLLDVMLQLQKEQDSFYSHFDKIMKARILYEKSLFDESLDLLRKVIIEAGKSENHFALLIASRQELEYLLALNFPNIEEKSLLNKQFKINQVIRVIQKMNQQSSLYELLKHRVTHKGNVRSEHQKSELNDLVTSEMSLVASSSVENFEIKKLHQLFQANYLISVGDYKSALHSFYELNDLLERNRHLWSNPPIYYLMTLEGVLDTLRSLRNYDGMTHFISQMKKLKTKSPNFNATVTCLVFLYELFPQLDTGKFKAAEDLMRSYNENLLKKTHLLSLSRTAELSLYTALIYLGLKEFKKAKKNLNAIVFVGKKYSSLPLYRTIRLTNLIILFELKEFDLIKYETRSIKRTINTEDKGYKIELKIIKFVNKPNLPLTSKKREELWSKISKDFEQIRHDPFEHQTLKLFDFSAWIESKVRRIPLSQCINESVQIKHIL